MFLLDIVLQLSPNSRSAHPLEQSSALDLISVTILVSPGESI